MKPRPCKHCGKDNHQSFQCAKRILEKRQLKLDLRRFAGRETRQVLTKRSSWLGARKKYLKLNPPDENGYYWCKITPCLLPGIPMLPNEVTIDHIIPRSKRPDLIREQSNLTTAHGVCNQNKASKVDGDYEHYEARMV